MDSILYMKQCRKSCSWATKQRNPIPDQPTNVRGMFRFDTPNSNKTVQSCHSSKSVNMSSDRMSASVMIRVRLWGAAKLQSLSNDVSSTAANTKTPRRGLDLKAAGNQLLEMLGFKPLQISFIFYIYWQIDSSQKCKLNSNVAVKQANTWVFGSFLLDSDHQTISIDRKRQVAWQQVGPQKTVKFTLPGTTDMSNSQLRNLEEGGKAASNPVQWSETKLE